MYSSRKWLLIVLTAFLALLPAGSRAIEQVSRPLVLILHSYSMDYSWTRDMQAGIDSVLATPEVQARYRVEFMDAKHETSPDHLAHLASLYRKKYSGKRFDGLILTDNHALDFIARHRDELFPHTPIAACGINDPKSIPASAGDMNIIIENVAHLETLTAALRQNPDTRKIYVMVDDTLTGQSIRSDFARQVLPLAHQVEIEILPLMVFDNLVQFTRERTKGQLIYLLTYFQDATGTIFEAEDVPRAIAANSPVPVYVSWDFQMKDSGAVGGCITNAFGHGQKAAQTLLARLSGQVPPAMYNNLRGVNQHTYNYAVLQRFGIPLSSLPENAVVLNKPLSYFEVHRSAILIALAVIGILGVIIALLLQNMARQGRINTKNVEIMALNREMIETQVELLSTLGEVIETRSHETANHVHRVAAYSELLAQKLGLAQPEVDLLRTASPMHDIGKIGIPEAILNKEGKLTLDEHDIIKHHTIIGHKILHGSQRELMSRACVISLQHHERWDGSGYPCGLKGEEIDLLARITALADVYDALSLDRVYKKAWPRDKVLQYIREQSGIMFDPRLVNLFFASIEELDAIKQHLADPTATPEGGHGPTGPPPCPLRKT